MTTPNWSDVLIVGAGLAGLSAASWLQKAGQSVRLLDKGRGVGGRMATRRIGTCTFDHGAQFITVRSECFAAAMRDWENSGIVTPWCQGFAAQADGHTRWRGQPAMNALPKHLAGGLKIELATKVVALGHDVQAWRVVTEAGGVFFAAKLLLTAPVPQSLELLATSRLSLEPALRTRLAAIEYERCIAVLAVPAGTAQVPGPGGFAPPAGPLAWLADNQRKGISAQPAVTLHATHEFSLRHWEEERERVGLMLVEAARPWLGGPVAAMQVHGWKYSKPTTVFPQPCAVAHSQPLLVLAGDAFAGPKVEGAALSGWAAAETFLSYPG